VARQRTPCNRIRTQTFAAAKRNVHCYCSNDVAC
jgi:hypothetical protein